MKGKEQECHARKLVAVLCLQCGEVAEYEGEGFWSRGGSAAEWRRERWSAAEPEKGRGGARWNRDGEAEQRLSDGGTTRDELQWERRLRAVAETSSVGTAASSRCDGSAESHSLWRWGEITLT
ncbi:hypothetical protein AAHE18_04G034500 [Arachis hypogaea]